MIANANTLQKLTINLPRPSVPPPPFPNLVDLSLDARHQQAPLALIENYVSGAPNLRRLALQCTITQVAFLNNFTRLEVLELASIARDKIMDLKKLDLPRLKTLICSRHTMGAGFEMMATNYSDHIRNVLLRAPPRFGINILLSDVTQGYPETLLSWALGRVPIGEDGRVMDLTESTIPAHKHSLSADHIEELLQMGADPNIRVPDRGGPTPLLIAIAYGRTSSAISMLAHKGDCTLRYGRRSLNAYLLAATRMETNFLFHICQKQMLVSNLERDPFLLRTFDNGSTPTHLIVSSNRSDAVRADELGRWLAVQEKFADDPQICEEAKLLDLATWDYHDTALHMAARTASPRCLKVLLAKIPSCDPFLPNKKGETALYLAALAVHLAGKKEAAAQCFSAICQLLKRMSKEEYQTKLGVGFFSVVAGNGTIRTSPLIAAIRAGLMTDLKLILSTGLVTPVELLDPFNSDGFKYDSSLSNSFHAF
jgi:hypothetical protein